MPSSVRFCEFCVERKIWWFTVSIMVCKKDEHEKDRNEAHSRVGIQVCSLDDSSVTGGFLV